MSGLKKIFYLYLSKNLCYSTKIYVVRPVFCGLGLPFHVNMVIMSLIKCEHRH